MTASSLADLDCEANIRALVQTFYAQVATDPLLGPVFGEQARVQWPEHIETLTAFWCKLELGIAGFKGAPTQKHAALSERQPFRKEQFGRWVALFHGTIDAHWAGPHADSIKQKALHIAQVQSNIVPNAEAWSPDC